MPWALDGKPNLFTQEWVIKLTEVFRRSEERFQGDIVSSSPYIYHHLLLRWYSDTVGGSCWFFL